MSMVLTWLAAYSSKAASSDFNSVRPKIKGNYPGESTSSHVCTNKHTNTPWNYKCIEQNWNKEIHWMLKQLI